MQIKSLSKPTCPLPLAFDTFSRLFKKELGISVSDYIREKKSHQKLRLPRLLCRFSTLTGTIYIPCLQIRVVLHREYISRMVNTDLMPVSSCCDSLSKSCSLQFVILSLTVVRRKNRCIHCVYLVAAIFAVVLKYSNLFLPFTFFLYCFHFALCYKLIVCPKTTAFMKSIRNLFAFTQRDKSLFLYFGKIHCL